MIVIGLELVFNRIPFRLVHFIYPIITGLIYILANYIGFLINDKRNGTYSSIIDWNDNDAGFILGTIETLLLFSCAGAFVMHIILWCYTQLWLILQCNFKSEVV